MIDHPMSDSLEQTQQKLWQAITQAIRQHNGLPFSEFMRAALYQPGCGYYSAGLKKLGQDGDFITAVELGSMFAQTLARQFAEVIEMVSDPVIMELGAGSGRFCADVLTALDDMDKNGRYVPDCYLILEVSADLKQQQQQHIDTLPTHLSNRVKWLDTPPKQPFNGVIFANEVLDALPVEVFRHNNNEYQRLVLQLQNGQLVEHWHTFPADLLTQLKAKELSLPDGYRSEFIPYLNNWMAGITAPLHQGLVLFVDYGYGRDVYYHPERHTGTLVCHQRHQANFNPYHDVGAQDITAFVDFTAVAEALKAADCEVVGFNHQMDLLMGLGVENIISAEGDYSNYYAQATELKQLMMPNEMGEKFKCIAALKNLNMTLSGFKNNRLHNL
ncbi:class I SAM-dependent methyltransferase [Marinicella pacifica]